MYGGGYFSTRPEPDLNGSGTARMMIAWGRVTSSPKIMQWNKTKVSVTIAVGQRQYQTVVAWDSSHQVFDTLCALEKGDVIFCCGTRTDKPYTTKSGEKKVASDLTADIVIPQAVINMAISLFSNPQIISMMQSANEPYDDYADESEFQDADRQAAQNMEDVYDAYEDFSAIDDIAGETPFQ